MKVLVTGATGFIGKEIVSELSKNNFAVIGIGSQKSKGGKAVSKCEAKIITADITDSEDVLELEKLGKIDVLIHSAGLAHQFGDTGREEFNLVNVEGTRKITALAVKLNAGHFILIGSTAVYGIEPTNDIKSINSKTGKGIDEDAPANPQTLYAESKLEAERVCREICEENNLPLTIFRLSPVIGEANVGNVARLISSIDRGRFLWIGKGKNIKSLIYKTDVARACVELVKKKNGETEIFNLSGEPVKMKDFVDEITRHLNTRVYKFSIPQNFIQRVFWLNSNFVRNKKLYKIEDTVKKWLSDDVYSARKIADKYGFEPQTSISEAIERQVKWYRKNKR